MLWRGSWARLEAIVADRNSPQKHIWRARMVLLTADGLGTGEIMRRAGTSKMTVWRWQERFVRAGVARLLRDKTRSSRIPPLPASVHERTVALTLADPPGEAAHWTADMMSKAARISVSSVQRIWQAHGLQHHDITVTSDIQRRTPAWSASERGGGIRYMLVV
jgi:transposase